MYSWWMENTGIILNSCSVENRWGLRAIVFQINFCVTSSGLITEAGPLFHHPRASEMTRAETDPPPFSSKIFQQPGTGILGSDSLGLLSDLTWSLSYHLESSQLTNLQCSSKCWTVLWALLIATVGSLLTFSHSEIRRLADDRKRLWARRELGLY